MDKLLFLLLFGIAMPLQAKPACFTQDISGAKSEEDLKALEFMKNGWMKNATVCEMGNYLIASPTIKTKENENIILILKKDKPVFFKRKTETFVYSPNPNHASFEKVMIDIWHEDNGKVKRIWYQTVGSEPEVMSYDTDFDGQADFKTIWKENEIIESFKWASGKWVKIEPKTNISNNANPADR